MSNYVKLLIDHLNARTVGPKTTNKGLPHIYHGMGNIV